MSTRITRPKLSVVAIYVLQGDSTMLCPILRLSGNPKLKEKQMMQINKILPSNVYRQRNWLFTTAQWMQAKSIQTCQKGILERHNVRVTSILLIQLLVTYRSGRGAAGSIFGGFSFASSFCHPPNPSHPLESQRSIQSHHVHNQKQILQKLYITDSSITT